MERFPHIALFFFKLDHHYRPRYNICFSFRMYLMIIENTFQEFIPSIYLCPFSIFFFFAFFLTVLFHVFLDSPQVILPLTRKVLNLSKQMFSSISIFHTLNISSCYYYFSLVLSASKQLLPSSQNIAHPPNHRFS